jgi:hypothetical protein
LVAGLVAGQAYAQSLSAPWQSLGPAQVTTASYGNVTGRVTSIAIDTRADTSGNTVYLGTTGGVWKSTNARAAAAAVTFAPLTDTLPVFSANAGSSAVPSLAVGAVSAMNNIVLAGTGDPNNAADSYYGEGILRSADGGLTWSVIRSSQDGVYGNHSFAGLAFAGFAWSTTSPGTVVAAVTNATMAPLVGAASATTSVMGLYYSTDYGVTWQMATVMDASTYVQRPRLSGANNGGNAATTVVWNPVRRRFYAALRYHGYYESADGLTWTRLASQPGAGLTTTACPSNTDQQGAVGCPIVRGVLAMEPVTGDTYALTVDAANLDQGLWRDACNASSNTCAAAVSFAQRLGGTSMEAGGGSTTITQGSYNLSLAAVNSGADTLVFAGAVDLYRCSLAGGCATMRNTTNTLNGCSAPAQVAPAQHALAAFATATQPTLFVGNDGGLWRSTDGVNQQATPCSSDDAAHFDNLNGGMGSLAMVQSLAIHPTDGATLLAGMGANGTAAITNATTNGTAPWTQIATGEGGEVAIDPVDTSQWYITTAAGVSIRRCSNGTACTAADFIGSPTIGAAQISGDLTLTRTPWLLDPAAHGNVVVGTCRVWRGPAVDGALWSTSNAISTMFSGSQSPACVATNALVRSVAAGGSAMTTVAAQTTGSQVIYAGMAGALNGGAAAGGHLFVTQAANTATSATAWSDVTSSPVTTSNLASTFNPGGYDISSIYVDSHDSTGRTVYVTIRGFDVAHVYRSTNAGASWTNISRNLPNVPANAVLVDPNDANTIYVGLDSGVYATTQVTTCETTNCWSVYGTGLPNTPVTALNASATLATGDGRAGELRAATYGRGVWQLPLLTAATPTATPAMTLAPTSLSFASQAVSTVSAAQSVTITNSGNAPLSISRIAISEAQLPLGPQAEFAETDNCTNASIATGVSCTLQVRFTPAAAGARTATMTIYGNVSGGQATLALSGTATAASGVVLTPVTLSFPDTTVNASSAVQNITISNMSSATISLGSAAVAGEFTITANTCGATLATQTGCTVSIAFAPKSSGAHSGSFTIMGDGNALSASLTGSGVLPATDAIAPASLTFSAQALGTTSTAQQVTLTNKGDVPLTLIAASTTGDFAATNGCGNSLAAHSSCAIVVVFQPKALGAATGVLTLSDQYRAQTVALSGTGVAPAGVSLSPLFGVSFAATGVGLASAPQTVTLTNNGGVALAISTIAINGDFSIVAGSNTCPTTLATGAACTMQVAFVPASAGVRNGALTVVSSAANSPHTLALSGAAVDFALTANGPTTATIASGQSATYSLLYSPGPAVAGAVVQLACSGLPVYAACRFSPATLSIDGNTTPLAVTIVTGTTSASLHGSSNLVLALLLAPAFAITLRRRRVVPALMMCALMMVAGCGAGRKIPSSGAPSSGGGIATPAGSYNVTVTATSTGLTRSVSLTLNVQ